MSDVTEPQDAAMTLSDEFLATAERLVKRYPVARSALLPLLHLVQSEHGYVSEEGIAFCAQRLALTKAEVGAVATFYTMFKRKPVGDYLLSVCTNPPCKVAGAQTIYTRYKDALGGELTDMDTRVSIEEAECLGICDAAPVVQVNYEMYGPLTDDEADRLLDGCRGGTPPVSNWSGEPAPTFAEVERELSGANDPFLAANIAAARHSVADYEVPPAYKTGETDIPVTAPGGDPGGHGGEVFAAAFGANGHGPKDAVDAAGAAATAAADDLVEARPDGAPSGLQVGAHHHPDAESEPDTGGETTDITDTSLPAQGREPADEGDATVASPDDPRPTPDTVTDPTPGAAASGDAEGDVPVIDPGSDADAQPDSSETDVQPDETDKEA